VRRASGTRVGGSRRFIPLEETSLIIPIGHLVLDKPVVRHKRSSTDASSLKVRREPLGRDNSSTPGWLRETTHTLQRREVDLSRAEPWRSRKASQWRQGRLLLPVLRLKALGVEIAMDFGTSYSSPHLPQSLGGRAK